MAVRPGWCCACKEIKQPHEIAASAHYCKMHLKASTRSRFRGTLSVLIRNYLRANGLHECVDCGLWKDPADFYLNQSKKTPRSQCKSCMSFNGRQRVKGSSEEEKELSREARKAYRMRPEVVARERELNKKWAESNRLVRAERQRAREARKKNSAVEDVSYAKVFERDEWVCQHPECLKHVDPELKWPHPESKSIDHRIPLAAGGEHAYSNVQLMHLRCNISKGAKILLEKGSD